MKCDCCDNEAAFDIAVLASGESIPDVLLTLCRQCYPSALGTPSEKIRKDAKFSTPGDLKKRLAECGSLRTIWPRAKTAPEFMPRPSILKTLPI